MNYKRPIIPAMSPDQDEDTLQIRQFLINYPKVIHMLSGSAEGRQELRKHRKIATEKLRTETDWREASFAAWMLFQVNKALATRKRHHSRSRPDAHERAALARCFRLAQVIATVLGEAALDGLRIDAFDVREAYLAADRIRALTKEYRQ